MRQTPTHGQIPDKKPAMVGRHRQVVERLWWPTRDTIRRAYKSGPALAAGVLACLALATMAGQSGETAVAGTVDASAVGTPAAGGSQFDRGAAGKAAGSTDTSAAADFGAATNPDAAAKAAPEPAPDPAKAAADAAAAAKAAGHPIPAAGLDQTQMDNAWKIVQVGQSMGLPARAYVIAIATSMQETRLYNLASSVLPDSYNYPNDGSGSDHDSVGLFQQRPSSGWGSVGELMDPNYAATAFYNALTRVSGWESMALTWAAQTVQGSAYPYAYAQHEGQAQAVVDALLS